MSESIPLVSCLCYYSDANWLDVAVANFKAQTYENKQLVLVYNSINEHIDEISSDIKVIATNKETIGECKNVALVHCNGLLVANWEQGCDFAPNRLTMQVVALAHQEVEIVFLDQISYKIGDKKHTVTNNRKAILESIVYLNSPQLRYKHVNAGCELLLLGDAVRMNYKAATMQGADLYTRRY